MLKIIENISFKGVKARDLILLIDIVQDDADHLDAIGALGLHSITGVLKIERCTIPIT
jgi:hypothetical protein